MRMRPDTTTASAPRGQRQLDAQLGALPYPAGKLDRPFVRFDDLLRDRHTQPGAVVLRREKRVEDFVGRLRRDAVAVVAYTNRGDARSAVFDAQLVAAVLRHERECVDRVVDDVREHLTDLVGVG